jgi:hypothetical protein
MSKVNIDGLIIVGQAPGLNGNPDKPLEGVIGHKIALLMGIDFDTYLEIERINLNYGFPGKSGKGDKFNMSEGRSRAKLLMMMKFHRFILLGRHAARCFDLTYMPLAVYRREKKFLILPHPSGINLWWNSGKNCARAAEALQEFIK